MLRRSFLRYLGVGAGMALAPSGLWTSTDPVIAMPDARVIAEPLSFRWMTEEMFRLMSRRLALRKYELETLESECSVNVLSHQDRTRHLMIEVRPWYDTGVVSPALIVERYLAPAAASLAHRVLDLRWTTFGELPMSWIVEGCHRVSNQNTGVSLRGLQMYDIGEDRLRVRFDVLGA